MWNRSSVVMPRDWKGQKERKTVYKGLGMKGLRKWEWEWEWVMDDIGVGVA